MAPLKARFLPGNYGAGHVEIWDRGTFEPEGNVPAAEQLRRGELKFLLHGLRLEEELRPGEAQALEKGNEWLFLKHREKGSPSATPQSKGVAAPRPPGASPDASSLPGAVRAAMPARVDVALATLAAKPFSDPDWLFEIKWDGERTVAFIDSGAVELRSRSHRVITHQFPELRRLPKDVRAMTAILDGEIVVLDSQGRSHFERLQGRFRDSEPGAALQASSPITYYLFDVLSLRRLRSTQRSAARAQALSCGSAVRFEPHSLFRSSN